MPELPETETIARDLHRGLAGATVAAVEVVRPDVLRPATAFQRAHPVQALRGAMVERTFRRAKSVVLDLRGAMVVVTPRFTGGLRLRPPDAGGDPYDCVRWLLADGRTLAYRDVRRLGTVAVLDAAGWAAFDGRLGVEPLEEPTFPSRLSAILRDTDRAVKVVLMDQARIAGVGNIYANEALWLAGIDPSRRGRDLPPPAVARLAESLRDVLRRAVQARGTSFRDYRDTAGEIGGFSALLAVYGRSGAPCLRCGRRVIRTDAVDGRSTFFCSWCQK